MKNRLNRIVTKSGDSGFTSINPNKRISKNSDVVQFLGDLDETNAYIGTLKADLFIINANENTLEDICNWIVRIQHTLFDIGGAICSEKVEIFDKEEICFLEAIIQKINEQLPPLKEFVLPGGTPLGAKAHIARTVCRRTERTFVKLSENSLKYKQFNTTVLPYLNRLSDFFFVLSRQLDKINNFEEQTWIVSRQRKN